MKMLARQHGFFDFGIGLALLTLFTGAAVVSTPDQKSAIAQSQQQLQSETAQTPADVLAAKTETAE